MKITISPQVVNEAKQELQELYRSDGEDVQITDIAIENWILRTITAMLDEPVHYKDGVSSCNNTSVAQFRLDPHCAYFGFAQCKSKPQPHSLYCEEHGEQAQ